MPSMAAHGAVIVANGSVRWTPTAYRLAAGAAPLVAADGGANHLARVGLMPAMVVGDLDSIRPATRAWLGEERIRERADQDRTDLDKALEYVLDENLAARVVVLGWSGDRVDHTLGNLGLLARRALGPALCFVAPGETVLALRGHASLAAIPGETWSFWTLDPAVRVSLAGVRWPVADLALDLAGRPSISNLATATTVEVTASGGPVLIRRHQLGSEE